LLPVACASSGKPGEESPFATVSFSVPRSRGPVGSRRLGSGSGSPEEVPEVLRCSV
jgi:hypothetical protein